MISKGWHRLFTPCWDSIYTEKVLPLFPEEHTHNILFYYHHQHYLGLPSSPLFRNRTLKAIGRHQFVSSIYVNNIRRDDLRYHTLHQEVLSAEARSNLFETLLVWLPFLSLELRIQPRRPPNTPSTSYYIHKLGKPEAAFFVSSKTNNKGI